MSEPVPAKRRAISWARALLVMGVFVAVLYAVELIDMLSNHRLDQHGLQPRVVSGLVGVATAPFLHHSWWQLVSITGPFVLLGWAVLLSGWRTWLIVSGLVMLLGGLAAWLVAPSGVIVGVDGLVFGWLGYLLARAVFARRVLWILAAVAAAFFFSGLFSGLLPTIGSHSTWQSNVCGFGAGVLTGWLLHRRAARRRAAAPVS